MSTPQFLKGAIGKITKVPMREVWKHEALDFTTWLRDNIDVLNDAIGIELANVQKEQQAGQFCVDLLAELDGAKVVIENQLEQSDHRHLGQLVTYRSMFEASTAIWIVADARPEHVKAVASLNEGGNGDWFLLKMEAIRIGDSLPAPLLTLIIGPSQEAKQVGQIREEQNARQSTLLEFWRQLIARSADTTPLHAHIAPSKANWIEVASGLGGVRYTYLANMAVNRVLLYIDLGLNADELNLGIFRQLNEKRFEIEETFGEPLEWESMDGRRACRIGHTEDSGGWRSDSEDWPAIHDSMIDRMQRLERAVGPHLDTIR